MSARDRNVYDEPEAQALTQEEVIEQRGNHIVPLTKQLEDLSQLIQGMTTAQQPSFYRRAGVSARFSTARYQSDLDHRVKGRPCAFSAGYWFL